MDEILIEEKKYVSSKRAAKITGYAKDYIGQLCREGRVPARLVGRSWYVLESAIADHRFGDDLRGSPAEKETGKTSLPSTWESPRYEAVSADVFPSVNRLQEIEDPISPDTKENESEFSQHLQDSWRAWFDRVGDIEPVDVPAKASEPEKAEEKPQTPEEIKEDEKEIRIPIRTVYQAPPEELLPRNTANYTYQEEEPAQREGKSQRSPTMVVTLQLAGALIAVILFATAVAGSGYFDTYILSNRQVGIIAGVALYNR